MLNTEPTGAQNLQIGELFADMPLTGRHWKSGFAIFFSFVIESWEMMIITLIGGMIGSDFKLTSAQIGSLMGSIYLGMIPGCLIWGKLTDKIGRKKTMMWSVGLYGILSLISAFSSSYEMLWWLRFASGLGLGGLMVASFPYFEELLPVKSRGRATVYLASGWPIGYLIAIGLTYALRPLGWHWILAISSLAGLWAFVIKAMVPESPYWAAGNGQQQVAKDAIQYLAKDQVRVDLSTAKLVVDNVRQGSFLEVFKSKLSRATWLQLIINFCFSWGYWALSTWMPELLMKKGLSAPAGYGFMALSALFMFPGYIVSSWLTGRYGRKKIMIIFVALAAIAGFGFAQSANMTEMYVWNFALSFFSLGAWGVWDTWVGELYPTEVRGVGYSVGATSQRVANAIAPMVIGAMLTHNSSFTGTVSFITAFLVATVIATFFLKETEGEILH
ncbi:MFS transporter [Alicyclobacillus fastidiosus]|uniref:MFS transporter n=1 Tax=Alicyclobacillus fastidiosus TaxID=392011 RepID=A0ABY6ZA75_9BACL|nr:MFS transporter [Alicyclobacillus fastidiosus]WAH39729.1 MFS transporter [Alicyclobacillus fastidiosus]